MSDIFLLIAGLAGLALGGEALVRGAVGLAGRLGLSPMVIGLTLVGFGTSTPELVTSLGAAFAGSPGIAVGNVVGSNIGNALLILGLAAVIAPIAVDPRALRRDGAVMAVATAAAIALMLTGEMTRLAGGALALALLGYLAGTLLAERRRPSPAGEMLEAEAEAVPAAGRGGAWTDLALALGGLGLTLLGARFLVSGAISIALCGGACRRLSGNGL